MLIQKQRKLTFTIRALVIFILGIGTSFHLSDAYGMGQKKKIEGLLLHEGLLPGVKPIMHGVQFGLMGLTSNKCVLLGVRLTGYGGVKAISHNKYTKACYLYRIVDNVVSAHSRWCSQWVFPTNNNPIGGDECYQTGGGGGGGVSLTWEPEPIIFPAGEFCGGGPSHSIYEDFKIIVRCGPAPKRD